MMDDHGNQQTKPETTRGLFDPAEKVLLVPGGGGDKRRSFQGLNNDRQSLPAQRRPRSRSSVTADNVGSVQSVGARRSYNQFPLQTLPEENNNNNNDKRRSGSMTVDSLQDMINTLKTMKTPDNINSNNNSNNNSDNRRKSMNRRVSSGIMSKHQSYQSYGFNDQPTIDEDNDELSRQAALAEAEAKLMGTYKHVPSSSTSSLEKSSNHHRQFSGGNRPFSTGNDINNMIVPTASTSKRMSLQQLPTLNENVVVDEGGNNRSSLSGNRRIQFNKPLNLDEAKKQHRRSASYSGLYANDNSAGWRSSAPPTSSTSTNRNSLTASILSGGPTASLSSSSLSVPSFNLVPFTPTRVNFSRDDANPHQRRQLFIAHLPFSALTPLFRSRQLVRGTLRVNKRNRSDAYVACEELDSDIYVCGSRDRNRALEGDVVAVRLVDVERVLREKKEKEEAKIVRNGGQVRARQPDEEDENEIIFGGDEDVDIVKPKYCGVVVAILERAQNQVFSGTLTLRRPNNKRAQEESQHHQDHSKPDAPRIVWFKAVDKRVPLIAIPIEQAPSNFVEQSESYANKLFVSSIKRWPITSLHPFGTLEKELGPIVDLDVQTMAILADNNVTHSEFSDQVTKCLPSIPYDFTPVADDKRRDFTKSRLFTIDPEGSDVLDDALSIQKLGDDTYEIGVHISDVTYFIKANSPLDKEARARGVRVDLIHKAVPMLPKDLTNKVTNLVANEVRFAFSVVWKVDSEGKILDTWFGKTIVKSSATLTYNDVQKVLDGDHLQGVETDEETLNGIEDDIRSLHKITNELQKRRFSPNGSMSQKREELGFGFDHEIDNDHGVPSSMFIAHKPESSAIIKELLLLANQSVAQKISSHLPELALLRRQARPLDRKVIELQQYVTRYLNIPLDVSSASGLEQSIRAIEDEKVRKLVSVLVLKTMQPPKYFCSGVLDILKFSHYSLNLPLFTHFTAPSRRFADIIVHRQLESALTNDRHFYLDRDTVQKLGQHCNVKKEAAIMAREQSALLFMALHLNDRALTPANGDTDIKTVYRDAVVIAVFDDYFDVMIPELNLERRIHMANLPVWRHELDTNRRTLTMFWKKGVDTFTGKQQQYSLSDDEYEDYDDELLVKEMDDNVDNNNQNENKNVQSNQNGINNTVTKSYASPSPTTSTTNGPTPESTKSSKRQSIIQARLSNSTSYSAEQSSQTIQALDKIRVILTIEMVRTPPLVRVLAANPYA